MKRNQKIKTDFFKREFLRIAFGYISKRSFDEIFNETKEYLESYRTEFLDYYDAVWFSMEYPGIVEKIDEGFADTFAGVFPAVYWRIKKNIRLKFEIPDREEFKKEMHDLSKTQTYTWLKDRIIDFEDFATKKARKIAKEKYEILQKDKKINFKIKTNLGEADVFAEITDEGDINLDIDYLSFRKKIIRGNKFENFFEELTNRY